MGSVEGWVGPEHPDRKELQVLEVLDKRVAVVWLGHPEFLVQLDGKAVEDQLVCIDICSIKL